MTCHDNLQLEDFAGRKITYLRVSVTNRCNLSCSYCMPLSGPSLTPRDELLAYEELLRLFKIVIPLGIRKLRITGGEPLVREDLPSFLEIVKKTFPDVELCMTTNGTLLPNYMEDLRNAGLDRLNVSLDTLKPERFKKISGSSSLPLVLDSIDEIILKKMFPLKVNVLLIPGVNEDEIEDFIDFACKRPIILRFIEMMPFGNHRGCKLVPVKRVEDVLERKFGKMKGVRFAGETSLTFNLKDFPGKIGLISPLTRSFCTDCNRLRITAEGNILNCLLGGNVYEIKTALRYHFRDNDIIHLIKKFLLEKPEGYNREYLIGNGTLKRCMPDIGG